MKSLDVHRQLGNGAMGNARWRGVPLKTLRLDAPDGLYRTKLYVYADAYIEGHVANVSPRVSASASR